MSRRLLSIRLRTFLAPTTRSDFKHSAVPRNPGDARLPYQTGRPRRYGSIPARALFVYILWTGQRIKSEIYELLTKIRFLFLSSIYITRLLFYSIISIVITISICFHSRRAARKRRQCRTESVHLAASRDPGHRIFLRRG